MTNGRIMTVISIAECSPLEHSAILLTCIKRYLVLKTYFRSFFLEWPFYTGFTVTLFNAYLHTCRQFHMVSAL